METLSSSLVGFAEWLLRNSWQASVLIGLVLLAQWIFQKRLPPRWHCGLWLLVVIRLLLPVAPATPFSIFNYANRANLFAPTTGPTPALSTEPLATKASLAVPLASDANSQPIAGSSRRPSQFELSGDSPGNKDGSRATQYWSWPFALLLLWLGGAVFLAIRILRYSFGLTAQLAQHETVTGPAVFDVLEQAKRLVGMRKVLPIVQSRAVKSPALMGFIRPWLLLPHDMVERLTSQELRFVFLHELAHLKRRDIAVNWLMTILQVLHWFNPFVWFAFSRMRADRELACDELALSFAKAEDNKSYGQAIIKLLEGFDRPAMVPSLVGILEDANQIKRRITMIAQFKPGSRGTLLAGLLLVSLGLMTLTDAQTGEDKSARKVVSGNTSLPLVQRWTNSLGMVFAPVEGIAVRFSIWETRVKDFEAFIKATGRDMGNKMTCFNRELKHDTWEGYNWSNPGFEQGPNHPVVGVNWEDAVAFCKWLTEKERKEGVLTGGATYRLPADLEWSTAVGLSGRTPEERRQKAEGVYPWGKQWPPPKKAGNYADMTAKKKYKSEPGSELKYIEGYDDGYAETAPVGSFDPN
jgi:beta-lactamase regulating signal transducer with metallopeptidase domain